MLQGIRLIRNKWIAMYIKKEILDEGYYTFKVQSDKDEEKVLKSGPYYYNNKLVKLKQWELDFDIDPDTLSLIPLQVKLHGLPMGYWSGRVQWGGLHIQIALLLTLRKSSMPEL